jgi:hypothetical protein
VPLHDATGGAAAAGEDDSHVGESTLVQRGARAWCSGRALVRCLLRGDDTEASSAEAEAPSGGRRGRAIAQPAVPSGPCRACATGGLDGGRRALSPITDHRNVKTRTWWIVREPRVGCGLPKPTV